MECSRGPCLSLARFPSRALIAAFLLAHVIIGFADPPAAPNLNLTIEEAIGLGARWLSEGKLEQVKKIVALLRKADPENIQVLFLEGQLALQSGNYTEAVRVFRQILTKNPGLPRVRLELARALYFARDYDASVTTLNSRWAPTCLRRPGRTSTPSCATSTRARRPST